MRLLARSAENRRESRRRGFGQAGAIARRAHARGAQAPRDSLRVAGTGGADRQSMAGKSTEKPKSYEDIVRSTVVDPDSSVRPSPEQIKAAREGFRALDADEQALQTRVQAALTASGADTAGVTIEISRDLVTLRGRVPQAGMLRVLEDAVAGVPGVGAIHDQVVVGTTS